jgi:AraC-like DNA-binding protein
VATLAKTPDAAWRDMIDVLYYDQSHFIRDFKQYTGITPTEYQKKPPMLVKGFLRSLGSAISLQTLPAHFELNTSSLSNGAQIGSSALKSA